jgi:predicted HTH transcriptional regulator
MSPAQLKLLLNQNENTTLEFKSKWYNIDHPNKNVGNRYRDELIKDILSLVNGNAITVGEKAYLIIGVDDKVQADNHRLLYDVEAAGWTTQRILQTVNSACTPRIQDIETQVVELDGKQLLVITLWPTPHLHETTRELVTPHSTFSKYVVFIRHNENIDIATAREREAILKLKQLYFADARNISPVKFGAVIGGLVGSFIVGATASQDQLNPPPKREIINKLLAGSIVGTPIGAFIGWIYASLVDIRYNWYFLSKRKRLVIFSSTITIISVLWTVYKAFLRSFLETLFYRSSDLQRSQEQLQDTE